MDVDPHPGPDVGRGQESPGLDQPAEGGGLVPARELVDDLLPCHGLAELLLWLVEPAPHQVALLHLGQGAVSGELHQAPFGEAHPLLEVPAEEAHLLGDRLALGAQGEAPGELGELGLAPAGEFPRRHLLGDGYRSDVTDRPASWRPRPVAPDQESSRHARSDQTR